MYKTSVETSATRKDLITVDLNAEKDNVDIYVRNAIDCRILDEAHIDISPMGFVDLTRPVLEAMGYRLVDGREGF